MNTDKKAFYADLRARYAATKEKVTSYNEAWEAACKQGIVMSARSFTFVAMQMKALSLAGYPGIDAKTFAKWRESGFSVRKGEHSQLDGIVWLPVTKKAKVEGAEADQFMMPKAYNLFHRSQVEAI